MRRSMEWFVILFLCGMTAFATEPAADFVLVDQFGESHSLEDYRGSVVVLVYGDRKGTKASRDLGEWLHVEFHPQAANLPPAEGQRAPVRPLANGQPGAPVHVVPVACTGKVPKPLRKVVQQQFRQGAPDVAVWLDFDEQLKGLYGQVEGGPNLLVFDRAGTLQHQAGGLQDPDELAALVRRIEALRQP